MVCFWIVPRISLTLISAVVILPTSECATVSWYEPSPMVTTSDHNELIDPVNLSLVEGSNASLSWNFSLTSDLLFITVTIRLNSVKVGIIVPSTPLAVLESPFQGRFNISWIPNKATLVIFNVTDSEDKGEFSCEVATIEVATSKTWVRKIQVNVVAPSRITSPSDNQTVTEGSCLDLFCNTTGKPTPNIAWTRVFKDGTNSKVLFVGNPWIMGKISRNATGTYCCTADNGIGSPVNHTISVNVLFKPDTVTLEKNTTENNGCTEMWVNFTCNSSKANPSVHNYVLHRNGADAGSSGKGTWIEEISQGETFVYQCLAYQQVDNVTSSNKISLSVKVPPAVEQIQNVTVKEGENVTKECTVTAGTPLPTVFWENVETSETFEGNPLIITNIKRSQGGKYRCIANNTCGSDFTTTFIDVQYKPDKVNLDTAPIGKVCRGSTVKFTCTADANPPVHTYVLFETDTRNSTDTFGTWTNIMNTSGKFVFKCEAHSPKGSGVSKDTPLIVDDQPAVEQIQNLTVKEGENVTGECNLTSGTPPPNLFWENVRTGQEVKSGKLLTITNITRNQTEFRCIANNTCGGDSTTMFIDVQYGPLANSQSRRTVSEGEHVEIFCLQDRGNPSAVVMWYKGNDTSSNKTTNSSTLEFQNAASSDEGWYTCFATNGVENVSATFFLTVVRKTSPAPTTEPRTGSMLCSEPPSANKLRGKAKVDEDCKNRSEVATKLVDEIVELLKIEDSELGESCGTSCSSVVVDFIVKFRKAIDAARVVNILKEAAEQDRFNGLKVYPDSIIQISSTTTLSTSTVRPSSEERCHNSFLIKENCEKNMLNIGIVIGFVFVVLFCCCLLVWWVHKRRKCNKDSKAVSPGDVQPLSSNHSTLSDGKPCDYAMSGPQPPVEVDDEQQLGAVPTYAVVDKSRKKDKRKKEAAQQKQVDDQYAVVDKSKKKNKNEADNTYAEVDMSKKSKKNPKPGEVLYADLGEFHQMKKMPEVSTSPKALPPIKRPEAYAETQYADITQFMKGNSEDPGAELPKDSTAPAATDSKEDSSAGNTGDGAQASNETGF